MGKPGRGEPGHPAIRRRQTQGTETSQYLEEEKARAIPRVAASEKGTAQTAGVHKAGAVAPVGL